MFIKNVSRYFLDFSWKQNHSRLRNSIVRLEALCRDKSMGCHGQKKRRESYISPFNQLQVGFGSTGSKVGGPSFPSWHLTTSSLKHQCSLVKHLVRLSKTFLKYVPAYTTGVFVFLFRNSRNCLGSASFLTCRVWKLRLKEVQRLVQCSGYFLLLGSSS